MYYPKMFKKWSSEDVRTAVRNDISIQEIANLVGRTPDAVLMLRYKYKKDERIRALAHQEAPDGWQPFQKKLE